MARPSKKLQAGQKLSHPHKFLISKSDSIAAPKKGGVEKETMIIWGQRNREQRIKAVGRGLYFGMREPKSPANPTSSIPTPNLTARAHPLSASVIDHEALTGSIILDTRSSLAFARGHIPGAINIGIDGYFATFVCAVIPKNARILLICDEDREQESVTRLVRLGYERVVGWLEGGINAWTGMGRWAETTAVIRGREWAHSRGESSGAILDVRTAVEFARDPRPGVLHIPLADLSRRINRVPDGEITVLCDSGYRASIAASILQHAGWTNIRNVIGGWESVDAATQEEISSRR